MKSQRGFSLIELALVLGISGLMLGFVLQSQQSAGTADCYVAAKLQLRDVDGAIQRFARKNDRLPMPAARTIGVEAVTYGREASGGAIDTAGSTSWGALPFQALGLAPSYASDCWGNKLTYVVTTALTTSATTGGYLDSTVLGNITVKKDASTNSSTTAAYAVLSHGEDALGAVKNNYSGVAKGWCTGGATLTTQNCLATAATVASAVFNNGKDAGAAYFDDVVVTGGRPQIASSSNVVCFGTNGTDNNLSGGLGDGTTTNRSNFMSVASDKQFTNLFGPPVVTYGAISNFFAFDASGTAYGWGPNLTNQLTGTTNPITAPTPIAGYKFSTIITSNTPSNGSAHGTTYGIAAAGGTGIVGRIYRWGVSIGSTPQLVAVAGDPSFAKLYMTRAYACALTTTGAAYCRGENGWGNLGDGTTTNRPAFTAVLGGLSFTKLILYEDITYVTGFTTCGLATTGRIYCWGSNSAGALGQGYISNSANITAVPTVNFTGGGGTGAAADAVLTADNRIAHITMTNNGSGYTTAPTVSFSGGGGAPTFPAATASINRGLVSGVSIGISSLLSPSEIEGGRGYTDIVSHSNSSNQTPSFCALETDGTPWCWGRNNAGQAGQGEAWDGGSSTFGNCVGTKYTSAPTVRFVESGAGSGAVGTTTLTGDCVRNVTITAAGSGYSSNDYSLVGITAGGGGFGASFPGGYNLIRRVGPVTAVTVTSGGSGYTSPPTVTFSSGIATGTAVLTGDVVTSVTITTGGSYNVTYDGGGTPTISFSGGGGSGAAATATVTGGLQLGTYTARGNISSRLSPVTPIGGQKFQQLIGIPFANDLGTFCGLNLAGKIYCWGANRAYGAGLNTTTPFGTPTLLNSFTKTTFGDTTNLTFNRLFQSGNSGVACAITTADDMYCWGTSTWRIPTALCPGRCDGQNYTFTDIKTHNGAYCALKFNALTDCATQTVNWGATCSASNFMMVNGQSTTVTNTAVGSAGTVTATCTNGSIVTSGATCSGGLPPAPTCPGGTIASTTTASHLYCHMGSDVNGWMHVCGGSAPPTLKEIEVYNLSTSAFNNPYACPTGSITAVFDPTGAPYSLP